MGGLVLADFTGPFRWAHHEWEGAFYSAWNSWPAQVRDSNSFPRFKIGGGAGRTSQPRDMLWQLKSTSPFHEYANKSLPTDPMGLHIREYLDGWVSGASAHEWERLARAFLHLQAERGYATD